MRNASLKRQAELRRRRALIATMIDGESTACFTGCGRHADDLHELLSRARGGKIDDPENCVPVCRTCHTDITTTPPWAESMGYALPSPRKDRR